MAYTNLFYYCLSILVLLHQFKDDNIMTDSKYYS